MDIQRLIKELSSSDDGVRKNAAEALEQAALNGEDITPAVPALAKALGDKNEDVKDNAARALRDAAKNGQDITLAVPALANVLKDKNDDLDVRKYATWALWWAALQGRDITLAVPALANVLKDKNDDLNVRRYAAEVLRRAALQGQDITLAVSALAEALEDEDADVKKEAAWALTSHYLNKGNFAEIEKLLGNKDANVKLGAAEALRRAAENGQDITPAVPALVNALGDKNEDVKEKAAQALTSHYLNKGNFAEIEKLLGNKDADVKVGAALALRRAADKGQDITPAVPALTNALGDEKENVRVTVAGVLESFALNCNTIESLNEAQKVIEESFKSWFREQPPTNNGEKMAEEIRIKMMIAQLVEKIAQKKAELSKKMDGEMLDVGIKTPKGEPGGKKGVYQAMRKREVF